MQRRQKLFAIFFLTLSVLLQNCSKEKAAAPGAGLRILVSPANPSKDPLSNLDQDRMRVLALVFEPLVTYVGAGGQKELSPVLLAELPTVSADQQTFSFKLKPGVKYHSGEEKPATVTSRDVVMSLLRGVIEVNSSNYGSLLVGVVGGLDQWSKAAVGKGEWFGKNLPSGIKIVNELEFQIKLTRKYPDFLALLTLPSFSVIPANAFDGGKLKLAVGTGPFRFDDTNVDSKNWNLKANPDYHTGKKTSYPAIDVGDLVSKDDLKTADFASLPLKMATDLVDPQTNALKEGGGLSLKQLSLRRLELLVFNHKDPVIKKLGAPFRKALYSVIDREKLISTMYRGFGEARSQFVPPGVDGSLENENIKAPSRDEALKQLKKMLGKKPIKIQFPESAAYWIGELQKNLADVGPYFEFESIDASTYLDRVEKGQFQIAPLSLEGELPEATNYLQLYYGSAKSGGQNMSGFKSAAFDSIFDKLSRLFPSPERKKLAEDAHRMVMNELPAIPLGFKKEYVVVSSKLAGFQADHIGSTGLKDLLSDK